MRQRVVDRGFITFQSNEERNVSDIAERIAVADVFSAAHFFIQVLQVFSQLPLRLLDFIVMGDVTGGALQAGIE
jgi:hypothetical protein